MYTQGTALAVGHWKAKGLDLRPLLTRAVGPRPNTGTFKQISQDHGIANSLDVTTLVPRCKPAIEFKHFCTCVLRSRSSMTRP